MGERVGHPALRRPSPVEAAQPNDVNAVDQTSTSRVAATVLSWGSLALAAAESLCVAVVGLSGFRVLVGASSLIAATAGGPAVGWHRNSIRIPLLVAGGVFAAINLLLLWNEDRLRKNPAAAWRIRPLTRQQKRRSLVRHIEKRTDNMDVKILARAFPIRRGLLQISWAAGVPGIAPIGPGQESTTRSFITVQ